MDYIIFYFTDAKFKTVNKVQFYCRFSYIYFRKTDCSFLEFNEIKKYFNEMKYLLEIFFCSLVISATNLIQKVLSKIPFKKKTS